MATKRRFPIRRYYAVWTGCDVGSVLDLEPPEPWGICLNIAATSARKAKGRAVKKLKAKGGREWDKVVDSPFYGLKVERRPGTAAEIDLAYREYRAALAVEKAAETCETEGRPYSSFTIAHDLKTIWRHTHNWEVAA